MKDFLSSCFYDGMSLSEAVKLTNSCFGKQLTEKQIQSVKEEIEKCTNEEWK